MGTSSYAGDGCRGDAMLGQRNGMPGTSISDYISSCPCRLVRPALLGILLSSTSLHSTLIARTPVRPHQLSLGGSISHQLCWPLFFNIPLLLCVCFSCSHDCIGHCRYFYSRAVVRSRAPIIVSPCCFWMSSVDPVRQATKGTSKTLA